MTGRRVFAQMQQQLPPVHIGEHHVQHDDVGDGGGSYFKQGPASGCGDNAIPGTLGGTPVEFNHIGVIVCHQHGNPAQRGQPGMPEDIAIIKLRRDRDFLWRQQVLSKFL